MASTQIAALLGRIAIMDDPVARNREITLCYRNLAHEIAGLLGRRDLNWFGFGAWASGTAGAAIRGQGLPIDFGTSENVAAGNLAIILDVAPPFVVWLREVERAGGPTHAAYNATMSDPRVAVAQHLAAAITAYQTAIELQAVGEGSTTDEGGADTDKLVAELVLLGNVLVGAHEQQLVDRFIDAAMPLGGIFGLVTTRFVHIQTPDGPLDVASDMPLPPYLNGDRFPPPLTTLSNAQLVALATLYGQAVNDDVSASDAWTWESYDERMGFILTFFRAYQRDTRIFDVPIDYLP